MRIIIALSTLLTLVSTASADPAIRRAEAYLQQCFTATLDDTACEKWRAICRSAGVDLEGPKKPVRNKNDSALARWCKTPIRE